MESPDKKKASSRLDHWKVHRATRIAVDIGNYVYYAVRRFYADQGAQSAGALTYTSLLAMVPLLAIAFAIFSAFPAFEAIQDRFEAMLFENLVPEVGYEVRSYIADFTENTTNLTAVGVVALGVSAVLLLAMIEATFNRIWRVQRSRPVVSRLLIFWTMLTLGPLLLAASFSLTSDMFVAIQRFAWEGAEVMPIDLTGNGKSLAETRMNLTGLPAEELIVVVAGGGARRISAEFTIDADVAVDPLKKEQQYQVKMLDAASGRVELFDKMTGHSIATRVSNGNAQFDADGLRFNLNGYAKTGDSFDVLTGQKSAGDARNMDEIMALARSSTGRPSFQDDFRSIAAAVGSTLESSRLTKLSAEAVRDAAVAAEDEVSGVNMDEEAAKLITQQQAYQAAARILQTAKEMFDTLMQIR
mgnify:CR=1 FL=1